MQPEWAWSSSSSGQLPELRAFLAQPFLQDSESSTVTFRSDPLSMCSKLTQNNALMIKKECQHGFSFVALGQSLLRSVGVCSFGEPLSCLLLGWDFVNTDPTFIACYNLLQEVWIVLEELDVAFTCCSSHIFLGLGEFFGHKFWTQLAQPHVFFEQSVS